MKSMTGYGRKRIDEQDIETTVEVKSVNHRYLDLNIKTPRMYSFLEDAIKTQVSASVTRGKVDIYVSVFTKDGADVLVCPNMPLIGGYIKSLEEIRDRFSLKDDISTMRIGLMADAISIERGEPNADLITQKVLEVLNLALVEYNEMREREGKSLCCDVILRAGIICDLVDKIEERSPICALEYKNKIASRMQEILGASDITEQRILAEASVYADKISVTEEIVRLRSHITQLRKMIESAEAVGRKLDFLVQELNREANTIGSKCNDYLMSQYVIDMKAEIEKIREQIQNLE